MKVISVENVSKKFMLAHDRPRNLADASRALFRGRQREDFWALKDVSFAVEQGEALGIIGHNGAGKSTMLKLLTRIMQPTNGRIRTRGRVSALIEVGAGFHPEMSGRENVYLNGSILGMSRREINRRFDDIVAFAGLERFIDTPVKRYSSGMYVRLGFAISAHTNPTILLVDEVLAVGDMAFQRKCHDRMNTLRESGVTICIVSHNLTMVRSFCRRTVLMKYGQVLSDGPSSEVIDAYTRSLDCIADDQVDPVHVSAMGRLIKHVDVLNEQRDEVKVLRSGQPLTLRIRIRIPAKLLPASYGVFLHRADGLYVHGARSFERAVLVDESGDGAIELSYSSLNLASGTYAFSVGLYSADGSLVLDYHDKRYQLEVKNESPDGGSIALAYLWRTEALPVSEGASHAQ